MKKRQYISDNGTKPDLRKPISGHVTLSVKRERETNKMQLI